jgi:hypothetical protein
MELLEHLPGVLLGLMGWAATALAVENATRMTVNDRRAMLVAAWMIWMIPAFGTLVFRGLFTTEFAALMVTFTTVALALIMIVGAFMRSRARS